MTYKAFIESFLDLCKRNYSLETHLILEDGTEYQLHGCGNYFSLDERTEESSIDFENSEELLKYKYFNGKTLEEIWPKIINCWNCVPLEEMNYHMDYGNISLINEKNKYEFWWFDNSSKKYLRFFTKQYSAEIYDRYRVNILNENGVIDKSSTVFNDITDARNWAERKFRYYENK